MNTFLLCIQLLGFTTFAALLIYVVTHPTPVSRKQWDEVRYARWQRELRDEARRLRQEDYWNHS